MLYILDLYGDTVLNIWCEKGKIDGNLPKHTEMISTNH